MNFPKHETGRYRGQYVDPKGQLKASFAQLMEADCLQAGAAPAFEYLMAATVNNPCAGCPVWCEKGPECKAFQLYHTAYPRVEQVEQVKQVKQVVVAKQNVPPEHPLTGLSIKQIAAKLNISISEVRRRKISGTL